MSTSSSRSAADQVIDWMNSIRQELENFRLQSSLGAMDARDHFEEWKKAARPYVEQARERLSHEPFTGQQEESIRAALDHLLVQLNLGKAEASEAFEGQRKNIETAMKAVDALVDWGQLKVGQLARPLRHEMSKWRIQLEILRLRYELRRMDTEEKWKNDVRSIVDRLTTTVEEQKESWDERAEKISTELQKAYDHLREAFVR